MSICGEGAGRLLAGFEAIEAGSGVGRLGIEERSSGIETRGVRTKEKGTRFEEMRRGSEEERFRSEKTRTSLEKKRSGIEKQRTGIEKDCVRIEKMRSFLQGKGSRFEKMHAGIEKERTGSEEPCSRIVKRSTRSKKTPFFSKRKRSGTLPVPMESEPPVRNSKPAPRPELPVLQSKACLLLRRKGKA